MRNYNNRAMTEFYKFLESNFKKNNTLLTYDLVNEYNDSILCGLPLFFLQASNG